MAVKNKLKVWLDQQIAIRELACSVKEFDDDIGIIDIHCVKRIHCTGINKIASRLGFTVYHVEHSKNMMERHFVYNGYTFFELVDVDEEESEDPLEAIMAEDEE